jgi:predicted O-methyltransferase YrrM
MSKLKRNISSLKLRLFDRLVRGIRPHGGDETKFDILKLRLLEHLVQGTYSHEHHKITFDILKLRLLENLVQGIYSHGDDETKFDNLKLRLLENLVEGAYSHGDDETKFDNLKLRLLEHLVQGTYSHEDGETKFDPDSALSQVGNKKAGVILLKQFVEILTLSGGLIGKIERILLSLRTPAFLLTQAVVAKCLLLMEQHPSAHLEDMYETGRLEQEFGQLFNRLLNDLGFKETLATSNIRELYAEEVFEGIGEISLPLNVSNEASHHENHMDMMFVVAAAKLKGSKRVFEFGTYMGRTTCGLASISDEVEVNTLNLPPEDDLRYGPYIGKLIADSPYRDRIKQLFSDSRKFDTAPYASSMDYIFVDADHSYEGVKNDTIKAFEMLKPGGIIMWHDFAPKSPGVYGYLQELNVERPLIRIRNTCLVLYIDGFDVDGFTPKAEVNFLEDA